MQSESSGRRRNDEFIGRSKLIFLLFFVTSFYVLNKIFILSENSMPRRSETTPGQEIQPGNRNWQSSDPKIIEHWENEKIEKNSAKLQETSIFQCLKYIFALLTLRVCEPLRVIMICCVSKAKMHIWSRKIDESWGFGVFILVFSFSQFSMIFRWFDYQFQFPGWISCPGVVSDRLGIEFSLNMKILLRT